MRFVRTKGEIRVEKGDFQRDFFFFLRGLDLVWDSATPATHIWERSHFHQHFFFTPSLKPSGFLAANLACTKLMSALKRFANSKESSSKDWLNEVKSEGRGAPFPEFLFPPPDLAKDDSSPSFSTFASWKL